MSNDELLLAISDMLDKKINPLEKRMDSMEKELKSDIKQVKDEVHILKDEVHVLKDEVHVLKDEVHVINLKLENLIEPRLNTIESCYLDTYKRYQFGVDGYYDAMKSQFRQKGNHLTGTGNHQLLM